MVLPNYRGNSLLFFLFTAAFLLAGCGRQESTTKSSSNTAILEAFVQIKPGEEKFVRDVRNFYDALAAHDWVATYEGRTNSFRKAVTKELYISTVASLQDRITPFGYEVLAHDEIVTDGISKKRLIIKFTRESAKPEYSVVWWKFEDGRWRCEEVGLRAVPLLNRFNTEEE